MRTNPALYCGTYEKYNNGSIDGKWMDLTEYSSAEEFFKACKELHKDEKDPEFMFQDYENFPEVFYGECLGIADIERLIEYASVPEEDREIVDAYLGIMSPSSAELDGLDIDDIKDKLVWQWEGGLSSPEYAYGEHLVFEAGILDVPQYLQPYIDYESVGRDYMQDLSEHNGYYFSLN